MVRFKDLIGQKFHKLLILSKTTNNKHNKRQWLCLCDCGNTTIVATAHLTGGHTKSCGCLGPQQTSQRCYKGTKDINHKHFSNIKNNAKNRNIYFNITIEYIQQLLEDQDYKCVLTGLTICGSRSNNRQCSTYSEQTASLDRIDCSKGYIVGNVRWVHKTVNYIKRDLSDKDFINWCGLIIQHTRKKK